MRRFKPWRYGNEPEKEPFHYTGCGLEYIYLLSGYEVEDTPYGESVTIQDLDGLREAIGVYLVKQKKLLDGKELRFLRVQMDLTQSELARLFGYDAQQVARWEKGTSKISGPADRLIRVLYGEQVGGKVNVREILELLDRMDSKANEMAIFTETEGCWRRAA
jgi:putative transcriptional regulator